MTSTAPIEVDPEPGTEHVDVVVVGAGLSGIGAARRLQQESPGRSFVVLEGREAIGGTWDLFRYPGVRCDSDMYTLSYPFRPWRHEKSIADAATIREYIRDTATETGVDQHIRYSTKVVAAQWSSARALWTVRTRVGDDGAEQIYTCSFLYVCAGYYNYEHGHQPDFPGIEDFGGQVVHPQFWPEDLDYTGKRVVVIGSGATAVTLIPAMAERAGHVTMLQRSPSYITSLPATDRIANLFRRYLPARVAHALARTKNVLTSQAFYQLCRRAPERAKRLLRGVALRFLSDPSYVDTHFAPTYQPWDQRLCIVPEGDFFHALANGSASIATDHIDRFVESGVRLSSGEVLEADLVVSATGLSLLPFGGMELSVDGEPVEPGETVSYRGVMLSGVPNFAYCIGYTNASWTLRADLSSRFVCRLLNHLDTKGLAAATPQASSVAATKPLLDLNSNYVRRSIDRFPAQGDREPWTVRQNYLLDRITMATSSLGREMRFTPRRRTAATTQEAVR